jgi:hypothetical protein
MKRKWIIWIVVIVILIIIATILIAKKYGKDEYGNPNITLEQKLNRNMQIVKV